jgi:hypothetical protein
MADPADRKQLLQKAPYPEVLHDLVDRLSYREDRGWKTWMEGRVRDTGPDGEVLSEGLTLIVQRCGPDSYNPSSVIAVHHYFPVPPATYDMRSWRRWLFDRLGDVDTHERMEDFQLKADDGSTERPYVPSHGPGNDCYLVREVGTLRDQQTSFRGEVSQRLAAAPGGRWECAGCGAGIYDGVLEHRPGCAEI